MKNNEKAPLFFMKLTAKPFLQILPLTYVANTNNFLASTGILRELFNKHVWYFNLLRYIYEFSSFY